MTGSKERRRQQRIRFEAPASVSAGQHTVAASVKDIAARGMFLFADVRIEPGSEIDVVLMLPEEAGLPLSQMVCCHGRVVRADPEGGQQYGIAVNIERMTPMPQV